MADTPKRRRICFHPGCRATIRKDVKYCKAHSTRKARRERAAARPVAQAS